MSKMLTHRKWEETQGGRYGLCWWWTRPWQRSSSPPYFIVIWKRINVSLWTRARTKSSDIRASLRGPVSSINIYKLWPWPVADTLATSPGDRGKLKGVVEECSPRRRSKPFSLKEEDVLPNTVVSSDDGQSHWTCAADTIIINRTIKKHM